jgi:hypothetical protein
MPYNKQLFLYYVVRNFQLQQTNNFIFLQQTKFTFDHVAESGHQAGGQVHRAHHQRRGKTIFKRQFHEIWAGF